MQLPPETVRTVPGRGLEKPPQVFRLTSPPGYVKVKLSSISSNCAQGGGFFDRLGHQVTKTAHVTLLPKRLKSSQMPHPQFRPDFLQNFMMVEDSYLASKHGCHSFPVSVT